MNKDLAQASTHQRSIYHHIVVLYFACLSLLLQLSSKKPFRVYFSFSSNFISFLFWLFSSLLFFSSSYFFFFLFLDYYYLLFFV